MAARVANRGLVPQTCALNDAPNRVTTTSPGVYGAIVWVRGETAGATFKLRIAEWAANTKLGSARATVTLSTEWQPVSVSYRPTAPGLSSLDLSGYVLNASPGTCFLADDVGLSLTPD
jgi:hypothetical protein